MSYVIDSASYNKAARYPVGHGYTYRPALPTSVVVHSTEGVVGQSLSSAANYLYNSPDVSADFLIGKSTEIIQFLDSHAYAAWHAGGLQANGSWTAQPAFANDRSIGIECLHAAGEAWPSAQKDTLAWLLRYLQDMYSIPTVMIETHGQIAIAGPYIRKKDPTNWPHQEFILWRDTTLSQTRQYRAGRYGALARQDRTPLALTAKYYQPGEVFMCGDVSNGYAWDASGIGFVALGDVESV